MDRLAASAGGGNIVTTKSWASMDDDTEALQRLNVILKVGCGMCVWDCSVDCGTGPPPVSFQYCLV